MKFKQIIAFILALSILLTDGGTTVAYAQQLKQNAPVVDKSTLRTEGEAVTGLPHPLGRTGIKSLMPYFSSNTSLDNSASKFSHATVRKLEKENYRPNEEISVTIQNGANKEFTTELISANGVPVAVATDETIIGDTKTVTLSQPNSFRPGLYTIRVTDGYGGVSEQDFTWGVLAINPDKSIYAPGETANLAIAVLNELGEMVCDAQVELTIKNPNNDTESLSTDNGKIKVNKECESHDFTLKPDYEANYKTGGEGTYEMTLKSQTKNGTYTITDSFKVQKSVSFDVKRISATRIYPPHTYPVTMEIIANQDFNGTVTETIPASFKVSRPGQPIKTDQQQVEAEIDSAASESAKPEPTPAPAVIAPDNLPETKAIGYSTVNNLSEPVNGKAVLGASVPNLGMPFNGSFPVSQEFGDSLVKDMHDRDLYAQFGMHGHDGMDFAMPEGTPILAVDEGKIVRAGDGDYGKTIVIQHSWGRSYYGHLSDVGVKEGEQVSRGATIGKSGNTGISTGPHLHFGIRPDEDNTDNGYYGKVDPAYYLGLKQKAGAVLAAATSLDEELGAQPTGDVQILTWKVNVKKGDKITIGYNYLAPRLSPQFYNLGPAVFTDTSGNKVFQEQRKWQIAADALELKFKRGSFSKVINCTTPCTQTVSGVGFKPKAVIFEWTAQTTEGFAAGQVTGMGFATASTSAGLMAERSVSYCGEDNIGTSDTSSRRSDTKVIMFQTTDCGATAGSDIAAEADFLSFDSDGFTVNWTTNNTSAYIIHYTAIGGSDLTNAMASTFRLTTTAGTQTVAEPGFQPDFVMFLGSSTTAMNTNTASAEGGRMNVGYASAPHKEASMAIFSDDNLATSDTYRQQRTDASIITLTTAGAQDAVVELSSFETNGFVLNKAKASTVASIDIFYLALKGGVYDVGSLVQPTSNSEQSVYTGFNPSGVGFASFGATGNGTITSTASLALGGASRDVSSNWCNDTTGVKCTSDWTARKKITINNVASTEDLLDFPLMVKLSSASGNIDFDKTQFDGKDIRFVDPTDPSTVLSHEIESWNEPAGEATVWVKVPKIDASSSADMIWMYYGNSSAPDGQDVANVWTNDYAGVWHMDENPGGTAPQMYDSTVNNNDGTSAGSMTSGNSVTGKIYNSVNFDGTDDTINAGSGTNLDDLTNVTYSAWIDHTTYGDLSLGRIVDKGTNSNGWSALVCNNGTNGTATLCWYNGRPATTDGWWNATNSSLNTAGGFYHTAVTYDFSSNTNDPKMYINGASMAVTESQTPAGSTTSDAALDLYFGDRADGARSYSGLIDEIRIANVIRSENWIRAEYLSGNNSMNTFSAEETQATGTRLFSEGSIWSDDLDGQNTPNATSNSRTTTAKAISLAGSMASGNVPTVASAEADLVSFDPTGFTLGWTINEVTVTARQVLYWAAGSITASQDDFRWYKNTNGVRPTTALEDENRSTTIPANKPYARLRANMSVGGNGMNASSSAYKLQYASDRPEKSVGGTTDWCNDTTGVTCTAPTTGELQATVPPDWCNDTSGVTCTSDWSSRRKITFNNASSSAALTDFPVLVKLDSTRINYSKTQNSGQDLRFVDPSDPNTALNHEIELWDENGTSYVWVEVPTINAQSNTDYIWMYYGNSSVSAPATQLGNATHETGVWDGNYKMVHHLEETGACTTANSVTDSTATANHGTCGGTPSAATGKIGGGRTFVVANTDRINNDSVANDIQSGSVTFSLWFRLTSTFSSANATDMWLMSLADNPSSNDIDLWLDQTDGKLKFTHLVGGNDTGAATSQTSWTAGTWYHVTGTLDSGGVGSKIYVNSVVNGTHPNATRDTSTPSVTGRIAALHSGQYFGGTLDEVRISSTVRSDGWIGAEYLTMTDAMNTYGSEINYSDAQRSSSGWEFRKKITFNNASASANLTDFPILVKLDANRIDYSKTQDDGGDIRFVDPNDRTTVLPHEIESWNENGSSFVWVKVPQIDARSTTDYIWMYYGNPGVTDGQAVTSVWGTNYKGVFHMKEDPSGSAPQIQDSTSNNNDGTSAGTMTSSDLVTGEINGAIDFDGTNDTTTHGDNGTLDFSGDFSYGAWIRTTSTVWDVIASKWSGAGTSDAWYMTVNHAAAPNKARCALYDNELVSQNFATSTTSVNDGKWHYIQCVRSGNTLSIYVDAALEGQDTSSSGDVTNAVAFTLGSEASADYYGGILDEVQIYGDDLSLDQVEANYLTQSDRMNSFGEEQPFTVGGTTTTGWTDVADIWCNDSTGVTCNTSWAYRMRITIDNSTSSTDLTEFPVMVKLDSTRIDYTKTQNSGQDIRFVDPADPSTVLNHEIETWDENGTSVVWVKVPRLMAKSKFGSIWMYYGNASVSAPATQLGNAIHETGVWESNFKGVWHNDEETGPTLTDSTSNANNAAKASATVPYASTSAKIGGAQYYRGTAATDRSAATDQNYFSPSVNDMTVSIWAKVEPNAAHDGGTGSCSSNGSFFISKKNTNQVEWGLENDRNNRICVNLWTLDGLTTYAQVDYTMDVDDGQWHHYVMYMDPGVAVRLYVDGTLRGSTTSFTSSLSNGTQAVNFGAGGDFGYGASTLDETRIANTLRSADWIQAEYLSGSDAMNTFGNEETQTSAVWKFKDNTSVVNTVMLTSPLLSTSATGNQQTYQESGLTAPNPSTIAVGERREWDFSLDGSLASPRRTYYFRLVNYDGTPLTSYTRYASITFGVPNEKLMRNGKWFNYGATQPFTF